MKSYHVGITRRKKTAVIQLRESKDCLDCEILKYWGITEKTKAQVKADLKSWKFLVLSSLRREYPKYDLKYVVID